MQRDVNSSAAGRVWARGTRVLTANRVAPLLVALLATAAGVAGCDDEPQLPPPPPPATAPAAYKSAAAPTTQQLTEGPRQALDLAPLPLTVQAPASWTVKSVSIDDPAGAGGAGGATVGGPEIRFIEGYSPHGPVHARLAVRSAVTPETAKRLISQDQQEAKEKDRFIAVKTTGPITLVEQHYADPAGAMTIDNQPVLRWRLTYYIPESINVVPYEINFLDLGATQFKSDERFLRSVTDTIKPAGGSIPMSTPTATRPATGPTN